VKQTCRSIQFISWWYQPAAAVDVVWLYALAALGVAYPLAPCVAVGLDLEALRLAHTVLHCLPCITIIYASVSGQQERFSRTTCGNKTIEG